jgi:hypothetical protein
MTESNGLRAALESLGGSLNRWTVMSKNADPFRLDTITNNVNAGWLAEAMERIPLPIHVRGIHYVISTDWFPYPKPDGSTYLNDDKHSTWLEDVVNIARWLNYVDFEAIIDKHSEKPVIRLWTPPRPKGVLWTADDFNLEVPGVNDLRPTVLVDDFVGAQPYHLAIFGEKSSLDRVLGPIADRCQADLFLATGDLTTTMVYQLAKSAAADGRPLIVLYFADCDPGGHNMAIVLSRKLSALQMTHFPDLEWQIWPVALTPDQVREHNLPSSPLKPNEKRADRWRQAYGVEQTEIDSIATSRPDVLTQLAENAIGNFYDKTLDARVRDARRDWLADAQQRLDDYIGDPDLPGECERVADRLDEMRDEMQRLIRSVQVDVDGFDPPDIEVPEAQLNGASPDGEPLCDSSWSFAEQTRRLIASKKYDDGEVGERQ